MKPAKSYLNENEAAAFLDVSTAHLRTLIRSHVATEESDMSKVGITQFQPADLLLLRILLGQSRGDALTVELNQPDEGAAIGSGELESVSILEVDAVPAASVSS